MLARGFSLALPLLLVLSPLVLSHVGAPCFIPASSAGLSTTATTRAMRLAPHTTSTSACQRLLLLLASHPKRRNLLPHIPSTSTLRASLHGGTITSTRGATPPMAPAASPLLPRISSTSSTSSTSRRLQHLAASPTGTSPTNPIARGPTGEPSPRPALRRAVGSNMKTLPRTNKEDGDLISTTRSPLPSASSSSSEDTIFALATGNAGPAGVAVVRISGPLSAQVLQALTSAANLSSVTAAEASAGGDAGVAASAAPAVVNGGGAGRRLPPFPAARRAVVRRLYDPATGDLLDEALVLWMPGPRSFTGEDTVELHTHGSRAVINGVLDALAGMGAASGMRRVRLAERGEFTQRAYGNGRMDLTGVEGLADLIAADTAAQRKQALKQMGGALRDMYEEWRHQLKGCLAHAEAVIDFGDDEEDVGGDAAFAAMMPRVRGLAAEIDRHLRDGGRGEIVRSGVRVAIVGPPNAGKSSLLNLLAARPAAIVSPVAGTTRDVVEVQMDIAGLPVTLSDTAGLPKATDDEIEREGMRRARSAVDNAHLAIFVVDATNTDGATALLGKLREEAKEAEAEAAATAAQRDDAAEMEGVFGSGSSGGGSAALDDLIVVANKADLALTLLEGESGEAEHHEQELTSLATAAAAAAAAAAAGPGRTAEAVGSRAGAAEMDGVGAATRGTEGDEEGRSGGGGRVWKLSCKTKEGLDGFMEHLEAEVRSRFQGAADDESPLITRRRHRQHVEACLLALRAAQRPQMPLDLAAEELRIASSELGRITGAVGVEELLDVIFRDFCIGK
ncbi:TrmE, organellal GTPase involved in tRNA modification [Ectocarpus siliculosus]|uniref:TrmE, organellal GTPase involved in tRNA modification n=1 Tax=Ectocarpus siliculosus TaxID=2880 RepID=D8LG51_ECTSI|nr:TrmE, organellal GTPase involved in tRNA modification [Ectocarpus siliculosus]|eukprot:CBN78950.1 TrmE, organellal GTPase involved in tRNA modification [Ectocarpus siliculosus]